MSISQKQTYISSNTTWRIHVYFTKTDRSTYHQITPGEFMSISQKQTYVSSNTTWRIHVYFTKTDLHIIKYHLENPCLFHKNRPTYHQIPPGESMSISQKQTYVSSNTTWRIHVYFAKTDLRIIKYHLENPCLFRKNRPTYHQIPPGESMSISQKQTYVSSNTTWRIHVYFTKTDLDIIKYHLENPCLFRKNRTTYHQIPPGESMSISQKQTYVSSNTTWRIHVYFAKTDLRIIKYHLENPCLFLKNRPSCYQSHSSSSKKGQTLWEYLSYKRIISNIPEKPFHNSAKNLSSIISQIQT